MSEAVFLSEEQDRNATMRWWQRGQFVAGEYYWSADHMRTTSALEEAHNGYRWGVS